MSATPSTQFREARSEIIDLLFPGVATTGLAPGTGPFQVSIVGPELDADGNALHTMDANDTLTLPDQPKGTDVMLYVKSPLPDISFVLEDEQSNYRTEPASYSWERGMQRDTVQNSWAMQQQGYILILVDGSKYKSAGTATFKLKASSGRMVERDLNITVVIDFV